ncbi:MAG: hypothetical protein G01um101477_84 [Candidatus Doudnabacteria bacterium Gr01-1014_77]|uniref:Prepilin-type N-terminal cleavage/methylation domain-containing protein n=1 Tax=Candidatus Doudnabacteria bacterium Gr01-1014_77 TaxID=2017133 RepID=A0A554JDG7_9BACT|nr:MAG: hypothetical protein G01um101477_84 [Candidatus Doudnabacteria bacterium Gr01-1014_77]
MKLGDLKNQNGFTLIELLVVIFIMVTLTSVFLVNFGSQSGPRSLNVAKNNLVSNLRRMQSHAISSKDSTVSAPAKYYSLTLSSTVGGNNFYGLKTYDSSNVLTDLSTEQLITPVIVKQISVQKSDSTVFYPTFIEVFYSVPFGRVLLSTSGGGASNEKIRDSVITLTLGRTDSTLTTTLVVNGVSGTITP